MSSTQFKPQLVSGNSTPSLKTAALALLKAGKITFEECDTLFQALSPPANTNTMSQQLVVRDELDIYPWRRSERLAEDALNQYELPIEQLVEATQALKNRYVEAVKAHIITPIAAMFDKYLEFCKSAEDLNKNLHFLMKLLLEETPETALKLHNWKTVQEMPLLTKNKYGHVIKNLNCPLFSNEIAELKTMNEKILAAMSEVFVKNKANNAEDESINTRKQFYSVNKHVLSGRGYLPILDASGIQTGILDAGPVETEITKLMNKINTFEYKVEKLSEPRRTNTNYNNSRYGYNNNYDYNYQRNRSARNRGNRERYIGSGYNDIQDCDENNYQTLPQQKLTQRLQIEMHPQQQYRSPHQQQPQEQFNSNIIKLNRENEQN